MHELILKENVLTDNVLLLASKGRIFKGGYIAIIKEYSFENSWNDKESIKRFRNFDSLNEYLTKNYNSMYLDFINCCFY
jgi:predicted butyrate kinase (DUF1464 family)